LSSHAGTSRHPLADGDAPATAATTAPSQAVKAAGGPTTGGQEQLHLRDRILAGDLSDRRAGPGDRLIELGVGVPKIVGPNAGAPFEDRVAVSPEPRHVDHRRAPGIVGITTRRPIREQEFTFVLEPKGDVVLVHGGQLRVAVEVPAGPPSPVRTKGAPPPSHGKKVGPESSWTTGTKVVTAKPSRAEARPAGTTNRTVRSAPEQAKRPPHAARATPTPPRPIVGF
jgi:hypothetical protein